MSIGYEPSYGPVRPPGDGRLPRLTWRRTALVVVVAFVGLMYAVQPVPSANAGEATLPGASCASPTWECWPVFDLDVHTYSTIAMRFTLMMEPGARLYARWECNGNYYPAASLGNYSGTASTTSLNEYTSSTLKVVLAGDSRCAYHLWSRGDATGRFAVTNARVVVTWSNGTPSGAPTLPPDASAAAPTFCSVPLPSGLIGPPAPTPCLTPVPTANATCAAVHWWCWEGTTNTSPQSMPFLQITAGVTYNYGATHAGCGPGSCGGTWDEFQKIDFSGSGSNCVFGGFNYGNSGNRFQYVGNGESMPKVITGTVSKTVGQDAGVCNFLIQSGSSSTRTVVYGNTGTTWQLWFDPSGYVAPTATPGPSGVTPPAEPSDPPTLPPNPGGGGNAFPSNAGVNICPRPRPSPEIAACSTATFSVDICAPHPEIAACATAQPTLGPGPSVDADAVGQALGDLSSGLNEKAPFGYVSQVGAALSGALAAPGGAAWEPCLGDFHDSYGNDYPFCLGDFSTDAASWRWLWVTLIYISLALSLLWLAIDYV